MDSETTDKRARTTRKIFSRETTVTITILAPPKTVWYLLTDAANYPKWNSTVRALEGSIKPGSTIKLKSILDSKRTFKLKVKVFEPYKRLVWGDPMGKRTYLLTPTQDGGTIFTMTEKIGGPLFPFFAKHIPSFDESFEQFVDDLKKEAEK